MNETHKKKSKRMDIVQKKLSKILKRFIFLANVYFFYLENFIANRKKEKE